MSRGCPGRKTKFSIVPFTLAVNVGSAYANASWMDTTGTSGNAAGTISDIAANRRPASLSADASNLASGAQVGFNAQFGSVVVGVEGDLAFPDKTLRC